MIYDFLYSGHMLPQFLAPIMVLRSTWFIRDAIRKKDLSNYIWYDKAALISVLGFINKRYLFICICYRQIYINSVFYLH